MTREDQQATIRSLVEERRGYEVRLRAAEETGDEEQVAAAKARVDAVDAQLRRLGHNAEKASARASKRPAGRNAVTR